MVGRVFTGRAIRPRRLAIGETDESARVLRVFPKMVGPNDRQDRELQVGQSRRANGHRRSECRRVLIQAETA